MADNYQMFSEMIPALTPDERIWVQRVLGCTQQPDLALEADVEILKSVGIDLDSVDLDGWPGFQWEIDSGNAELWLYGEEHGNVSHTGEFVRAFLARFRPADCWPLTWSETCSKPRIGEFSGGGLFVTATSVNVCVPHDWLAQQQKDFERAARSLSAIAHD